MLSPIRLALLLAVTLGAITMTSPSQAQERASARTVSVSATGTVAATPDVAHITTGVATEAATAREAMDLNNKAMSALIDGLKALGLETRDIQTINVSVEPRYQPNRDGSQAKINGYRVANQVRIVQRNIAKLGETLDRSITLGANMLGGIGFEVSNAETLRDEARRRAMANALRRAELYAGSVGMTIDKVVSIAEAGAAAPGPRVLAGARMAMAESVPVEAGEQTLAVTVQVTWELK